MSSKIIAIPKFENELKRLVKKYHSLKEEYIELVNNLKEYPGQGIYLGNNCFKIRLAISSKGKGKSGGARVITYLKISDDTVYLLTIYDKNEKENINDGELADLLKEIPE